jgi:hypothetical protein
MIIGQRRQERKPHLLTGSVARRMVVFEMFCSTAVCGGSQPPFDDNNNNNGSSGNKIGPTMSRDDYDLMHSNSAVSI